MIKRIATLLIDGFADWEAGLLTAGAKARFDADVAYAVDLFLRGLGYRRG